MLIDILMPKMGESIMEGTILHWLKKPGEKIERDESILEISTDKVDTEVPSPDSGILAEVLFKEGEIAEVGKVIARLETEAGATPKETEATPKEAGATSKEAAASVAEPEPVKETQQVNEKPEIKKEQAKPTVNDPTGGRFYSPLVMNIAQKESIGFEELEKISGSGLERRVTKKDILDYLKNRTSPNKVTTPEAKPVTAETPKTAPAATAKKEKNIEHPKPSIDYNEEGLAVMPFDTIRQKMAEHMIASVGISPHVNAIAECDMTAVDEARSVLKKDFEVKEGFKLSYMPFICEAVVKALKDFPLINSIIDDSTVPFSAITRSRINLGLAVAMENGGLIVPVIKNADSKNITGIARDINDLAKRARIKKLTLDEIQGGTFTLSNFGVFGNIFGTMIINQPQVAILGIGAVKKRASVVETEEGDFIAIKPIMYLTLSFDHRLIDGALGGSFVMRVAHYLENYEV